MKKVSALILAVLVLISAVALVSCGGKPDATSGSSSSSVTKDTGFSSEVTEPTQSTATTATTETTITTTGTETTATTATTEEPVPEPILPEGKSLKVLAIGNSFSVDAMEYLYDIAKSAGYTDIVLGNLYIGGCTLEQHVGTLAKSTPSYDFYLNKGGNGQRQEALYLMVSAMLTGMLSHSSRRVGSAVSKPHMSRISLLLSKP